MRELLFRGKSKEPFRKKGEWVYGGVCDWDSGASIFEVQHDPGSLAEPPSTDLNEIEVERETVGQFTGREDVNGEKLFEGDIIQVRCVWFPPEDTEDLSLDQIDEIFSKEEIPGGYDKEITKFPGSHYYRYYKNYQVVWSKKREQFELKNDKNIQPLYDGLRFTIIGNAIDNPELLKK